LKTPDDNKQNHRRRKSQIVSHHYGDQCLLKFCLSANINNSQMNKEKCDLIVLVML